MYRQGLPIAEVCPALRPDPSDLRREHRVRRRADQSRTFPYRTAWLGLRYNQPQDLPRATDELPGPAEDAGAAAPRRRWRTRSPGPAARARAPSRTRAT